MKTDIKKRNLTIVWNLSKRNIEKTNMHTEYEEINFDVIGTKIKTVVAPKDVWLEPVGFFNPFPQGREELDRRFPLIIEQSSRQSISDLKHRSIVIYLPDNYDDLLDGLKNTKLGMGLQLITEMENEGIRYAEVFRKAGMNQQQVLDMLASEQVNEAYAQNMNKKLISQVMQSGYLSQRTPQSTQINKEEGQK